MNCKEKLPAFFGFEGVGILFRDHNTDNLFNIGDDENDADEDIKAKVKRKALLNEELTD